MKLQSSSRYSGTGEGNLEYHYTDGDEINATKFSISSSSYGLYFANNPNPNKKIEKIVVFMRVTNQNNPAFLRKVEVISPLTSDISFVTLRIPNYIEEKVKNVKVKFFNQILNWPHEEKISYFSIIDKNNNEQIYEYKKRESTLKIVSSMESPRYLRVYLRSKSFNGSVLDNALFGINFKTNNPKSHWTGTKRVIRDNHYAEALENLGKRSFSTPDRRYSTVGFRLVQRP